MATFGFYVNDSKLAYAVIRKCIDLHRKAHAVKINGLAQFFPDVEAQWDDIITVLQFAISSKIAWTGQSMTKADTVPDDTRIPPNVEINSATIRIMKQKADDLGITLSSSHEFYDENDYFQKAMETWSAAAKMYMDILSLAEELTMYRYILSELHRSQNTTQRSPGQLIPFMDCDIPLADGSIWVENLNWEGIENGFGDTYWDIISEPAMETLKGTPISLDSQRETQNVAKQDDPDNPGTKTIYPFSISSAGYSLIGALKAVDSNGTYHQTGITYSSVTEGKLTLDIAVGDAPDTVTFELLGLKKV